jgi:FAD/FMN-containing dehydrogenase
MGRPGLDLVFRHIPGARDPLQAAHRWSVLCELSSGMEGALRPLVLSLLEAAAADGEIEDAVIAESDAQAAALWRLRHSMSEAMKPEGGQAKYDVSVPVASVPGFLAEADAVVEKTAPGARVIAFGHMGDGNIHYDVLQPAHMSKESFAARSDALDKEIYDCIDRFDGSISAEHGVGLARREEIANRKPAVELAMMRAVKAALDPAGVMNPGKML